MKDDDSSSIVRSQTAHQVNVSEHTGNATTPQNHVTSDVDREIAISQADAGPTREIRTDAATLVDNSDHAHLNTLTVDAPQAGASDPLRTAADGPAPAPPAHPVPTDAFQDERAAIEQSRDSDQRTRVPTEPALSDAASGLSEPLPCDATVVLPGAVDAPHLERVATEPAVSAPPVGEAKPVFSDHHAVLPAAGEALHDPDLEVAELGHAHPLSDPEPDHEPGPVPASLHPASAYLHAPPHALSPTTHAALADLNKDEFQGRLAGIKREVQALNDRLSDFETELDKDGLRPARP